MRLPPAIPATVFPASLALSGLATLAALGAGAQEDPRAPTGPAAEPPLRARVTLDAVSDGVERGSIGALAEVGYALDEALHGVHGRDASSAEGPAPLVFCSCRHLALRRREL